MLSCDVDEKFKNDLSMILVKCRRHADSFTSPKARALDVGYFRINRSMARSLF